MQQPDRKRRKHDGVRFGPPLESTAQPVAQYSQPSRSVPRGADHVHNERKLAEAQLHGRKFHLDTSSCTQPERELFFSGPGWNVPDMMAATQKLNMTKDLLDSVDIK